MADRAFDCHTQARPKGRGDAREGDDLMDGQMDDLMIR